ARTRYVVEPVEALNGGPDPEVADRQDVGPLEVDEQEHVRSPAPQAAAGRNLLANLVVRQFVEVIDLELAGNDVLGQRADVLDLPAGEPDGPEVGGFEGEQLRGRRHPPTKALLQPPRYGLSGVPGDLLTDDRVDKHTEGIAERSRFAPGFGIDRLRRIDQPRQLSITGLQG